MKRRVLVTGSSKGIGKAIALRLAQDGFEIVLHYFSDQQGAELTLEKIKSLDGKANILKFDVSNREETRRVINADIEKNGAYYGVISNAGLCRDGAFPAMTDQDWDQVMDTNLDGFFNVVQPCIMPMIREKFGGRIVTISSVSGLVGNRGQVNYSASKAGLIGATKALALELAKREITVNCVAPGMIDTEMITEEQFGYAKDLIPLRRMGKAEEVADLVSFVVSDKASYVTRQVISINGGLI